MPGRLELDTPLDEATSARHHVVGADKCGLRFVILSAFECLDPRCMLTIETHGRVAVLNIDDGKANVVSEAFSKALNKGLDTAERDAAVDRDGRLGNAPGRSGHY